MPQLKTQRDAPGTKREYETIYILRADAATDSIQDVNVRMRKIIEDRGGKVISVSNWGKRKLAYEIRKQLKGIYLYWLYLGEADMVAEIERNLRMQDLIIRYYSVRVDQDVNPEARPSQMDEEGFLAAATTIPDEEDTYMGRGFVDEESDSDLDDEDDFDLEEPDEIVTALKSDDDALVAPQTDDDIPDSKDADEPNNEDKA